jgi:hypothetical protein
VKQAVHLSHLALGSVAFIKVCSKMDTPTYPMINEIMVNQVSMVSRR